MRRLLASCVSGSSIGALALVIGCSTGDPPAGADDTGAGGKGGTTGGSGTGGASSGGKASLGGSSGSGATGGNGAAGSGATAGGGAGGSAGSGAVSGASGSGGTPNGGAGSSSGGVAGSGATAGGGGMAGDVSLGGGAGQVTVGGMGGMAGAAAGAAGTAGSGGPGACPAGALFCSGFEDSTLPAGATYLSSNDNNDWTIGTALDKTVWNAGAQSLEILKITSYAQREVVVPAAQNFWFRAYFRTDVAVGGSGGNNHNLFFEAAWQGGDKGVEVVEEDCMLGMNIEDTRYGSNGTKNQPGCPSSGDMGTQLAANTWHCIEGHFDGVAGNVELFVGGTQVMALTGEAGAKRTYTTLRFGYRHYHERQRLVWYDDVATAAARVGCP